MAPRFSLQTVLDIRHSKVDALEIELGRLLLELQETQERLAGLYATRSERYQQLIAQMSGEFDLFMVNSLRAELEQVAARVQSTLKEITEMQVRIEHKQNEVVAARQAEKMLDTLKDKELERFQSEQAQRELHQQDDIYIAQAFRQRSGGSLNG